MDGQAGAKPQRKKEFCVDFFHQLGETLESYFPYSIFGGLATLRLCVS